MTMEFIREVTNLIAQSIIGIFFIFYGLFSLIKGRIPFKKEYHGVKKIGLHCRIEGGGVLLIGAFMLLRNFVSIETTSIIILFLVICIITVFLEIVFKAI